MARPIRGDRGPLGDSKRVDSTTTTNGGSGNAGTADLPSPFGCLALPISDADIRETTYEVFAIICPSTGGKSLTYIPQSDRTPQATDTRSSTSSTSSHSRQRSLTSTAASKMKNALGLKSSSSKRSVGNKESSAPPKHHITIGDLVSSHLGVSKQTESRIRRGLLWIAVGQVRSTLIALQY